MKSTAIAFVTGSAATAAAVLYFGAHTPALWFWLGVLLTPANLAALALRSPRAMRATARRLSRLAARIEGKPTGSPSEKPLRSEPCSGLVKAPIGNPTRSPRRAAVNGTGSAAATRKVDGVSREVESALRNLGTPGARAKEIAHRIPPGETFETAFRLALNEVRA